MTSTAQAKIFLSDERGLSETSSVTSLHTFSFGKFYNEHKSAVDNMYVLNDDMLGEGKSLSMLVQENSFIVLLPVAGAIVYQDSLQQEAIIAAGQIQIFHLDEGSTISLTNPFRDQSVNFVQIWMRAPVSKHMDVPVLNSFDVNAAPGSLVRMSSTVIDGQEQFFPFDISIGKFNGRDETVYQQQNPAHTVFIFVLTGAFEVQGRLLHARDGLAFWKTPAIEIEALSNDAIMLLVELKTAQRK